MILIHELLRIRTNVKCTSNTPKIPILTTWKNHLLVLKSNMSPSPNTNDATWYWHLFISNTHKAHQFSKLTKILHKIILEGVTNNTLKFQFPVTLLVEKLMHPRTQPFSTFLVKLCTTNNGWFKWLTDEQNFKGFIKEMFS